MSRGGGAPHVRLNSYLSKFHTLVVNTTDFNFALFGDPSKIILVKFHISLEYEAIDYLENEHALDIYDGLHSGLIRLLIHLTTMGDLYDHQVHWVIKKVPMRLYHIQFSVYHRDDILEIAAHDVASYVVAECPYQALFFVRSRLNNTPWKPCLLGESWQLVDPEKYDPQLHSSDDIEDAISLGLVVLNIEHADPKLAISA